MLEFAREQWLWLFLLVGVFYVAWWFARRYRKRRVTYGLIWQRVAKRVLPPGWKRVLRTVLTLLVSGLMLSAVVLKAAGLQKPASEQTAPLLVFILVDNSPSMRVREGDKTRAQLAQQRAQQIVDALGNNDRAMLVWKKDGRLLMGRWLKTGDTVGDPPPIDWDWAPAGFPPFGEGAFRDVPRPPSGFTDTEPLRISIELSGSEPFFRTGGWQGRWDAKGNDEDSIRRIMDQAARQPHSSPFAHLSDHVLDAADWHTMDGTTITTRKAIGSAASNDGIGGARFVQPEAGDGTAGQIEYWTWSGNPGTATDVSSGTKLDVEIGRNGWQRVILPIHAEASRIRIAVDGRDSLPEDDGFTAYLDQPRLATITLCYPAADGEPNDQLVKTLRLLLPGREVLPKAVPSTDLIDADLLICDRALPAEYKARYLLCFGVVPAEYGSTAPTVSAEPNMQLRVDQPDGLGFEVPDLTLLSAREAVPLAEGHTLVPLAKHMRGGTLIGVKRGTPELLYVGFIPHLSTLLLQDDWSGVLLLSRWLAAIQGGNRERLPLFMMREGIAHFQLNRPGALQVHLSDDDPWLPCYGPRDFTITTGADGRGTLGPFVIPGEYVVSRDGHEIGRLNVLPLPETTYDGNVWNNVGNFSVQPTAQVDLEMLFSHDRERDWRDSLPGALLWVALGLMVLEWLLWLIGATE